RPERQHHEARAARGDRGRRGCRDRHRPAQAPGRRPGRDDARHALDQDHARDSRARAMRDERGTQPSEVTKAGEAATVCPSCGTARAGADRFCETCGHDYESVAVETPAGWELVIEPDREYHARFAVAGVVFPESVGAQTVVLDTAELAIGRRDGGA